MPLKSGFYFLSAFSLDNRAIGANPGERIRPVIVQPPGTQPEKVSNDFLMLLNDCLFRLYDSYSGTRTYWRGGIYALI